MILSPLYTLTSASGLPSQKRTISAGQSFYPTMLSPDILVEAPKTEESAIEVFKKAVRERRFEDVLDVLDELYVDKSILVRALLETAVELVNAASPATVLLILSVTREAMEPEQVLQVANLLVRSAARSEDYPDYVDMILNSRGRSDARDALTGMIKPSGEYAKLQACSTRYWAYPMFIATLPTKIEVAPKFVNLSSRLEKKKKDMKALT